MNIDYRAELQRLVKAYDDHGGKWPEDEVEAFHQAVERARAHLSQPEPEGPTDEEMNELFWKHSSEIGDGRCGAGVGLADEDAPALIREALARWGRPAVQPVPVSERPWEREGWCDAEGRCWWWNPATNTAGTLWWSYSPWEWMEDATYSLPHHALPLPTAPTETNGTA